MVKVLCYKSEGRWIDSLPPLRIGQRKRFIPVLAYADEVTVCVTQPAAFTDIQQAIQGYEKATGAFLNPRKSKALAIGKLAAPATALRIDFQRSHQHTRRNF